MFFFFFLHISACLFVLLSELEDARILFFTPKLPLLDYEIYILSIYFVMTTIATVGYGDLYPTTTVERIYVMMLMMVGVLFFTMLSGALASILTAYDSQLFFGVRNSGRQVLT